MKRFYTVAAIAAALLATTATPAQAGWRHTECRYQYLNGHRNWTQHEVRRTIDCATERWGVSRSTAFYVANRESHFGQFARNPYSGACGVFQHIPRYFNGRLHATPNWFKPLGQSCLNARSNVLAAIWMARHGWGPWSL